MRRRIMRGKSAREMQGEVDETLRRRKMRRYTVLDSLSKLGPLLLVIPFLLRFLRR